MGTIPKFRQPFNLDLAPPSGPVPIDGPYLEVAYMPSLGPGSIAMIRHLRWLHHNHFRDDLTLDVVAHGCGLGSARGFHCFDRITNHDLLDISIAGVVGLPDFIPIVSATLSRRLPVTSLSYVTQYHAALSGLPAATPLSINPSAHLDLSDHHNQPS